MSQLALELIEKEKQEKHKSLSLANLDLIKIPEEITELTDLKVLNLSDNFISDISLLKNLLSLQSLNLSNNSISNILYLGKLVDLHTLDLRYNKITDIPTFERLVKLHTLNLSHNAISNLSSLKGIQNIFNLNLSNNSISDISFLHVPSKKNFFESLDISDNNISDLSPILPLIKENRPVKWDQSNFGISVKDNPLLHPNPEIVKQGNKAILNYFKERETQGEVPLYEAKLLIIGEGGAGKTSLAKRLIDPTAPMPKEKDSTKGIDIHYHHFTTPEGNDFRMNVWDFGGQEIYHATHQFFPTKRSLYVLLDDTCKDDKNVNDATFNYWLQVVELLSENSPVLIVQNEKSDRSKQLEMSSIKGRFDNVLGSVATNIGTCRNLAEVRKEIEHKVQKLPLVGQMLPKQWVAIRKTLEEKAKSKDYISLKDYFDICAEHQISEEERALFLSSYLHDLGTFLHFQDDWQLRELFILNNTWATDAVYKVLDNEDIKDQYGYFTQADLEKIWSNRRYRSKRPQLLALMENFQLCFSLKDRAEKTWLAPQLLPVEAPKYEWNESQNLQIRYRYAFMPKGLLSRFFVRMNRYVHDLDKAWKSGVFLQRESTNAFVRETYGSKEIVVRVEGAHPKELMTIIAEEFDKMNDGYGEKLRVRKLIPCICNDCKDSKTPHFYDYKNLKRRKEKGKTTTECEVSFEDVSVEGLLNGVFAEDIKKTKQDLETNTSSGLKTIELFLTSSNELEKERREIELWLGRQNKQYIKKGIFLHLNIWEDFLDSVSITRKQDDYNKKVLSSDIFVSLFGTKVGKYTEEEFDTAFGSFLDGSKPKYIYTFFKKAQINITKMNMEQLTNYKRFTKDLSKVGHFPNYFSSTEDLILQLKKQLDKVLEDL